MMKLNTISNAVPAVVITVMVAMAVEVVVVGR